MRPEVDNEPFRIAKRILLKHFSDVEFARSFIPSYGTNWIFASAKKKIVLCDSNL